MSMIAELFAARIPRYTSYPTAPHFHAGVTADTYRFWLDALDPAIPLSLYFHIPFCDTLCWFCGCHTTVVNRYAPITAYLEMLLREIDLVAGIVGTGRTVRHIHWGGGSPTLLQPEDMERLASALRSRFRIAADAEFGIEIDPRGFDLRLAETLSEIGVTRASIGVQDFDDVVQRRINRVQSFETTAACASRLRNAGITSLNIDLLYGLPFQTVGGIESTIEQVLTLDPDRLAIFGYAHVPHFKKHQNLIPEAMLPNIEERFAQAEAARAILCRAGYLPIGIDHFSKPDDPMAVAQREGRLARNFQGYTTDASAALLGFGPSSIGALPFGYAQNHADVPTWRAALTAGRLPVARGIALNNDDRARRAIIERLMCDLRVDIDSIAANYGLTRNTFSDAIRSLDGLRDLGVITIDGGAIAVAEPWRAATRLVCSAFDDYLSAGIGRHTVAV
ncbi:MAG TPA: oxygen-independent coproporphyrinogen III oxidase [Rhizomicrobium sp.]|nr:oxygen-independent coproporphyrinogen III oxidase [Rhizomicrobium sp.]